MSRDITVVPRDSDVISRDIVVVSRDIVVVSRDIGYGTYRTGSRSVELRYCSVIRTIVRMIPCYSGYTALFNCYCR